MVDSRYDIYDRQDVSSKYCRNNQPLQQKIIQTMAAATFDAASRAEGATVGLKIKNRTLFSSSGEVPKGGKKGRKTKMAGRKPPEMVGRAETDRRMG